MFTHTPELKNIFNQSHQETGNQAHALASAVLAYAENINDPSVLLSVVERIAHKHTSLGIRPEHYDIVGRHLLASISEVLGSAATDELNDAWTAAYQQLAKLFIDVESELYQAAITDTKGWSGWRPFRVRKKVAESSEITSFYLEPTDGGELPDFKPGQYISLRLLVSGIGIYQPRQYSLSKSAGERTFRISVKIEKKALGQPEGVISNQLHNDVYEGDIIDVSSPYGEFYLKENTGRPVVLLSGGVGITPMIAISDHLYKQNALETVYFIHSARDSLVHAFKETTDIYAQNGMSVEYYYDSGASESNDALPGPFSLDSVVEKVGKDADYYLCGPTGFMSHYLSELRRLDIDESQIHAEAFGSGGVA